MEEYFDEDDEAEFNQLEKEAKLLRDESVSEESEDEEK